MNMLTPLNPDTKPEQLPESQKTDTPVQQIEQMTDMASLVDYNVPDVEVEQSIPHAFTAPANQSVIQPAAAPRSVSSPSVTFDGKGASVQASTEPTSGFLVGYVTSLFAGISVLYGLSTLGFILLDHFITQPEGAQMSSLFDTSSLVSSWHVWLVASLVTFTTLYLILSRSTGKRITAGLIPERQMQAAEVARSIFTAVLIISSVGLVASLLFTLLNGTLAAAEIKGEDIAIQIIGTIATFIWVAAIVWHQTAVHVNGRNGIPGAILAGGAIVIAVVAAIFLLAAGRNAVIDSRTLSDLSTVQSKLMSYKAEHDSYPDDLSSLAIDDESIKKRLGKYTYTHIENSDTVSPLQSFESEDSPESMYETMDLYGDTYSSTTTTSGYKLCATFLTDNSSNNNSMLYGQTSTTRTESFSSHDKGEHCVNRDA